MKKIILLLCLIMIGSLIGSYRYFYGREDYYTKITTNGKVVTRGGKEPFPDYTYNLPAYDADGTKREVEFNSTIGRPIKRNAYLKLTISKRYGVTSWEELKEEHIPTKALSHLK
ncbi:YxeA family protein [Vagococcus sp. PNs007]|uniref:YxeA family protein n=1 Tax=Vagococcus proximus TaxID=2991417 RepID=A0ABT5WYQ8_9ENTE|nr:YxeA family protein [Vagococcus proximus]MDF0478854.1 YxeA family protein [Vagococcus proximus]